VKRGKGNQHTARANKTRRAHHDCCNRVEVVDWFDFCGIVVTHDDCGYVVCRGNDIGLGVPVKEQRAHGGGGTVGSENEIGLDGCVVGKGEGYVFGGGGNVNEPLVPLDVKAFREDLAQELTRHATTARHGALEHELACDAIETGEALNLRREVDVGVAECLDEIGANGLREQVVEGR